MKEKKVKKSKKSDEKDKKSITMDLGYLKYGNFVFPLWLKDNQEFSFSSGHL